jgi:Asp-tRNA(Asn)/Glu-tRNA(Gln) amidotransferase A subunit family amidase
MAGRSVAGRCLGRFRGGGRVGRRTIAHATGRLGSMTVPAATCGLVGLSPGVDIGLDADVQHGIIATTVADVALGTLGFLPDGGRQREQPYREQTTERATASGGGVDPQSLFPHPPGPPDAYRGFATPLRVLIGLGHDVVATEPEYPSRLAVAVRHRRIRPGERVDWRLAWRAMVPGRTVRPPPAPTRSLVPRRWRCTRFRRRPDNPLVTLRLSPPTRQCGASQACPR